MGGLGDNLHPRRRADAVDLTLPTWFVAQYTTPDDRQGHLVTSTGTILGTHQGLWHYTIGQRARLPGMKEKWFVASKDVERNRVVVVPGA